MHRDDNLRYNRFCLQKMQTGAKNHRHQTSALTDVTYNHAQCLRGLTIGINLHPLLDLILTSHILTPFIVYTLFHNMFHLLLVSLFVYQLQLGSCAKTDYTVTFTLSESIDTDVYLRWYNLDWDETTQWFNLGHLPSGVNNITKSADSIGANSDKFEIGMYGNGSDHEISTTFSSVSMMNSNDVDFVYSGSMQLSFSTSSNNCYFVSLNMNVDMYWIRGPSSYGCNDWYGIESNVYIETSAPTSNPTHEPTSKPTIQPTYTTQHTERPTTNLPTIEPSSVPTSNAIEIPSQMPRNRTTTNPTLIATNTPTSMTTNTPATTNIPCMYSLP